jgi:hypothetical protein
LTTSPISPKVETVGIIMIDSPAPNTLDTFIDALLSEAYPNTSLPSAQKDSMKNDIKSKLIQFINMDLLNAIPSEHVKELTTLIENKEPQEKIDAFIAAYVPDQASLIATSLINFRNMYLGK